MIKNTHAHTPQHTLSAYSDNAAVVEGYASRVSVPIPARRRTAAKRERRFGVLHQGGNPQPSDRDRAVSRREHRRRRRDPRRRRDRPRRQAEGRPERLQRLAPAHPDAAAAVGRRDAHAQSAHGAGAGDHARRPARRGRVQQRVRPPEPDRLLPQLRARRRPRTDARLRQADHARRRPRRDRSRAGGEARPAAGRRGDRARRPGDADRPGRRRGQFGGLRR